MNWHRLPTVRRDVVIVDSEGHTRAGRIFLPSASRFGPYPPSIREWIEDEGTFFAFTPSGEDETILVNKADVVVLMVEEEHGADASDCATTPHAVMVACAGRQLRGDVHVQPRGGDARVLDELNRVERFLVLRDGSTHCFVRKSAIRSVRDDPAAAARAVLRRSAKRSA